MARGALIYVWLVIGGGAAVLAQGFWTWQVADWVRFLFMLTLSMFASGMKVTLSAGAGTMSLNFLFILIGIGSLSLGECLAMGTLGMFVQRFFQANRKPTALQIVFNIGAMAISVAASYAAYRATLTAQEWVQAPLRLLLAAGVFFLVNTMSVALVIGWTENRRSFAVWRDTYFWSFPNYLVGAFSAWCVNAVSDQFGWQASLLILPVLYLIYRSHRTMWSGSKKRNFAPNSNVLMSRNSPHYSAARS